MAFQPYTDPHYFYPSGQELLGADFFSADGLTETSPGSLLFNYIEGDYAYPSLVPIPHVEITIFALDPQTVTITVYRTVGRRTMPVRGQINVYAVGGRNVVDWEAPFGVPLTYHAQQFDIDGNPLGYTIPFATQLDVTETWVQNPFDPVHATPVTMAGGAAATLPRPTPTETYWAAGSGLSIAISGQRRGLVDVDVSFLTRTENEADRVRDMFGDPYDSPSTPPILVIRTGAGLNMRLPQPFYASIPEPIETPLDTSQGGSLTRWECSATEVRPPAPQLVAAVLTYEDFDVTYPDTYESEDAAYSTYLEADRDYSIAGSAGEQDNS